jgi:type I restriction enzyme, S subunit
LIPDRIRVRENDILICVRNGSRRLIGKSVLLDDRVAGETFGAFMAVYRSQANPFLQYFFQSSEFKRQIDAHLGATINQITNRSLNNFVVALPSAAEQAAIAERLGDVDSHIAALARVVAKKQAIKQGMMHQLLTGRTRLSGYRDPWTRTELGNLLAFKNGLNKSREYFGEGTPIVNFMDVMGGPLITTDDIAGRVTLTKDEIARFSAKIGDLFFTRTSETVDEVGTAAALVDNIPNATFSGFILRGRPKVDTVDSRFLAYLFQLGHVRRQVTSVATYTTRALTNGQSLGRVIIDLPKGTEQREIIEVITDADCEIELLQKRIEKARAIKAGMMQELLSGRTRLPVKNMAE